MTLRKSNQNHPKRRSRLITGLITMLILASILTAIDLPRLESTQAAASAGSTMSVSANTYLQITYLPISNNHYPHLNRFGVESNSSFSDTTINNFTTALQVSYTRLNGRIAWRALQPEEGDPINWDLLVDFETELRTLRAANIHPIVVVDDYPRWATDNTVRIDGLPTSCGPLLPERYDDYAVFMQALVSRYSTYEFNVHIWEMGNEPDVDPNLVPPDYLFGCWGDWDDPFYNGRSYGEMLQTVTPAIKAVDPLAQVWIGGLLLNSPNTIDTHIGKPEDFLRGILEAGAAPYFDMVAYHVYLNYNTARMDRDLYSGTAWDALGGHIRGKARFLRSVMAEYNVQKPLFITETSQICGWCTDILLPGLFDMQANMVPRSFPRAMADDISGFVWYTLEEQFWRYCSLLDQWMLPKPAYSSYQTFMHMVSNADLLGPVAYGDGIEAYTFVEGPKRIDIIFSIDDVTYTILVPQINYIAAYDRFGALITPTLIGSDYSLSIQYEPIYLVLTR
jgi:hypothetical protein